MIPFETAFYYFSDGVTGYIHIARCTKRFQRSNSLEQLPDVEQQLRARLILQRGHYYQVHNVFYVIGREKVGRKYGRGTTPSLIVTYTSGKEQPNFLYQNLRCLS